MTGLESLEAYLDRLSTWKKQCEKQDYQNLDVAGDLWLRGFGWSAVIMDRAENGYEQLWDFLNQALPHAYQNGDVSALLLELCGKSMFDLLREAYLIPRKFHGKAGENPVLLTNVEGELRPDIGKTLSEAFLRPPGKPGFWKKYLLQLVLLVKLFSY